jgi:hypothetical protein
MASLEALILARPRYLFKGKPVPAGPTTNLPPLVQISDFPPVAFPKSRPCSSAVGAENAHSC